MKDAIAREKLKALVALLAERDRRYTERFAAQEGANRIALDAANERLARMNEFRDQLTDQAGTFVTKDNLDAKLDSILTTVGRLENTSASTTGRGTGMATLISYVIAAGGVLTAIGVAVFK